MIQSDEVYLASFPFGDIAGMKLRPVLTLSGPVGPIPEVLVAYISSVIPNPLLASDIVLDPSTAEHAATNLKTKSALRLHKLATIHARAIVRRLGRMSAPTIPKSIKNSARCWSFSDHCRTEASGDGTSVRECPRRRA